MFVAEAVVLGGLGGLKRADDHSFHHHVARGERLGELAVLVHHAREQRLIERAPVDADADGLLVFDRALDHDVKIVVIFSPMDALPGLMRYLARARAVAGYF